jgi:hypothetical protein
MLLRLLPISKHGTVPSSRTSQLRLLLPKLWSDS